MFAIIKRIPECQYKIYESDDEIAARKMMHLVAREHGIKDKVIDREITVFENGYIIKYKLIET